MSYISKRGYVIEKSNYEEKEINKIRKKLTVKPLTKKEYSFCTPSYSVYLESSKKLYLPRYYLWSKKVRATQ